MKIKNKAKELKLKSDNIKLIKNELTPEYVDSINDLGEIKELLRKLIDLVLYKWEA